MYSFMMAKNASAAVVNKQTHAYVHIRRLDELRNECEATAGGNTDTDTFISDATLILHYITHIYVICTSSSSSNHKPPGSTYAHTIEQATDMLQEFNSIVRAYVRPVMRSQLTATMYRIRAFGYGR
jgi:hypothetical protein